MKKDRPSRSEENPPTEIERLKEEVLRLREEREELNRQVQMQQAKNRQYEGAIRKAREEAESIVKTINEPLLVLRPDLTVKRANPAFYDLFRISPEQAVGRKIYDLGNGQWNIPSLQALLEKVLPANHLFNDYEVQHVFQNIGYRVMLLNAQQLDHMQLILLGIRDITLQVKLQQAKRNRIDRLQEMIDSPGVGVLLFNTKGRLLNANDWFLEQFGYRREEVESGHLSWENLTPSEFGEALRTQRDRLTESRIIGPYEKECLHKDGTRSWMLFAGADLGDGTIIKYCMDVGERKRAELALRASEESFRALVEASSDVVYRMGPDWSEMRQLMGRDFIADTPEPSRNWLLRYILPEDQPQVVAAIEAAVGSKSTFELEHRVLRPDDSIGWTLSRAIPRLNEAGEIIEWLGMAKDITERKQAEDALRESEGRLAALLEQLPQGVGMIDPDGRFTFTNNAMRAYVSASIPSRNAVQRVRWRVVDAEGRPLPPEEWPGAQALAGKTVFPGLETTFIDDAGQEQWLLVSAVPFRSETGTIAGAITVAQDFTERKRAEAEIQTAHDYLRAVLAAVPAGVVVADASGEILLANSEAERILGGPIVGNVKRSHGNYRLSLADGTSLPKTDLPMQKALAGQTVTAMELRVEHQDGNRTFILANSRPLQRPTGSSQGAIVAFQDITGIKEFEEKLKRAKAAADEANEAKSQFLANMSHEIRTPMTVFMAAIEHLLTIDHHPEQRELLSMADHSAKLLRTLIDDILEFSRIEARKVELKEEPFVLWQCVAEAVEMFTLPAREKGLELKADMADNIPETVVVDGHQVRQILINLIGNAVKFTQDGEIRVSVRASDRFLEFSVADTGIGIPEEKQHLLFQSFSQVDDSFHRQHGGTGLGLAISRGLVELMGGKISVRSEGGRGSVFTFAIPLKTVAKTSLGPPQAPPVQPDNDFANLRVLLADDEPIIRQIIELTLRKRYSQVETAETGKDALQKWQQGEFDLILMDLQMPELDGIEVTRKIREGEAEKDRRTCIIGFTAHARREVMEKCLAAGMDQVLTKPVQRDDLFSAIDSCFAP